MIRTYTIITTSATDSVGRIHDRMPMAITPDHWAEWLDPRNHDVDQLRALMTPPLDGSLDIYAVSKLVNSVRKQRPRTAGAASRQLTATRPDPCWWQATRRVQSHQVRCRILKNLELKTLKGDWVYVGYVAQG